MVELLARAGMGVGELVALEADAVVQIGGNDRLRILLGKLRNDRYVLLHLRLVALLAGWTATGLEHVRAHQRLIADHGGTVSRHSISRIIYRIGAIAGVEGVHRHRLGTPLATRVAGVEASPGVAACLTCSTMSSKVLWVCLQGRGHPRR